MDESNKDFVPHYDYLTEVETRDHRFAMLVMRSKSGTVARSSAKRHLDGLGASLVACSKDAPEFGDTCKRELVG